MGKKKTGKLMWKIEQLIARKNVETLDKKKTLQ